MRPLRPARAQAMTVSWPRTACAVLWLAFVFSCASVAAAQTAFSPRELAAIRLNVIDVLAHDPNLPLPVRQRRDDLVAYYQDDLGSLLWLGAKRAAEFTTRLRAANVDGLDPDAYPANQLALQLEAAADGDLRTKSIAELHFSAAFLEYASDLRVGRFLPHKVDPNFFLQARHIDRRSALRTLAAAPSIDDFFAAWQPQAPEYAALKATLTEYQVIAARGGWPQVPLGETLKPGMSEERVAALRARLAATGEAPIVATEEGANLVYDDALVEAVKAFQARHGLDVDGVVGPATIVALNTPIEARIEEIAAAMERWRWMPEDLGDNHIIVNIAGFDLKLVRSGEVEDRMAVVVGKPFHRTPAFSDEIEYVELNPYWNVPISIALKEELPKLRQNPAARQNAGFEAVVNGQVYSLTAIDWSQYGPGNFPFRLRQRPGPTNALGRAKFMFPNKFNVYLHDTPARSLFGRSERAFSHGCIRLSRPLDLAEEVLGPEGWSRARVDQVVASGDRTVVNLKTPLPVHITYMTAWVDDGVPNFRRDVYEQDKKLLAALEGQTIAW